ncbi:MAG: bifunctional 4-hydroxy-2-oxoglutarate aldolase/2-dehydro-3-deoxy-phosphogluconate aldolase [Desulfobacterales bacterium]|jgi:2-dehydro-3-deoxyphosphogluconate aldolase/(4S)-4-hydroxy-2-oxoglutarate aldolase
MSSVLINPLESIIESGVIGIMRADSSEQLLKAADALKAGGVIAIEVTMTTPGALEVINKATTKYGDEILFGVGSVLDPETARSAILSGAQFVVCPTLNLDTIEICKRYSVPVVPGAYTPSEILTAWEAGADMVKIFPASIGGPSLIKAVKAPLPQIEVVPVGGVNLNTAADYIRAGASALGVGSSLINKKALEAQDYKKITENARLFQEEVRKGRKQ